MKKLLTALSLALMSVNASADVTLRDLAESYTSTDNTVAMIYLASAVHTASWALELSGQSCENTTLTPLDVAADLFNPTMLEKFGDQQVNLMIAIAVLAECGIPAAFNAEPEAQESSRKRRRDRS